MASTKFTDILTAVSKSRRLLNDHKKRTFEWFRKNANEVRRLARAVKKNEFDPKDVMIQRPELLSKRRNMSQNLIGKMIHFYYDPKWKKELPYYDTFPLVFPIHVEKDRFTGINLHYLPPNARAILMGHLWSLLQDEKDGEKRIALSYQVLKSASKYRLFKPCIKTYLYAHVRSRYLFIPAEEWEVALLVPSARFEKASETKVWEDSLKMVNESTKKKPRQAGTTKSATKQPKAPK